MKTVFHLFGGLGGGALGFQDAGFTSIGAIDMNEAACRDFKHLLGEPETCADIGKLGPDDLRKIAGKRRPDVLFTSPPCKGFSGCLPEERAEDPKYLALNSLTFRGIWIALEAWDPPPPLILFENVPRITSRGAAWLERIVAMLHSYGYAVDRGFHDCGEIGGLGQHRKRFLLVARHQAQIPCFLRVPSAQRVRSIGEVIGDLPVPSLDSGAGGPMHRLPSLCTLNWIRLALIPAGGDWRDLPPAVRVPDRAGRPNGPFGVQEWHDPAHAVLGATTPRDTWGSVSDPRLEPVAGRHAGAFGVESPDQPAHTVTGQHGRRNWDSVADPRLTCTPRAGTFGVECYDNPAHTVIGQHRIDNAYGTVADPRVASKKRKRRSGGRPYLSPHEGAKGVTAWDEPSTAVIAHGSHHNGPWQVADPRLGERYRGSHGVQDWETTSNTIRAHHNPNNAPASIADPRLTCSPQQFGCMVVQDWEKPSYTVRATHRVQNAPAAVADPRIPEIVGPGFPRDIDDKRPTFLVIEAADGTWHRPLTTLELAALQDLPVVHKGAWLELDGNNHAKMRERIGNAVPRAAARAMAHSCMATLIAADKGNWPLSSDPIWVGNVIYGARDAG